LFIRTALLPHERPQTSVADQTDHDKRDRHRLHVDDNRATKVGWGRVRAARGRDLSCSTGGVNVLRVADPEWMVHVAAGALNTLPERQ